MPALRTSVLLVLIGLVLSVVGFLIGDGFEREELTPAGQFFALLAGLTLIAGAVGLVLNLVERGLRRFL